jgi:hypothetical protein
MRIISRAAGLALLLLNVSSAQDAIFYKSGLVGASGRKTIPVELIISNTGVTVRSKDKTPSVIVELLYSSINNLGYTFVEKGKGWLTR